MMAVSMEQIQAAVFSGQAPLDEASISSYEKKIDRARKWGGWIWGVISIVAFVFTLGVAYAVFMGANATDSEVEAADKAMIIDHNGGIDPNEIDAKTHKPVGHHPDMREDIKANTRAVIKIEEDILPPMLATQRKLDKRSEYQYELTKWESRVNEARRKKRQPPDKPPRLEELETELALGKY